MLMAALLGVAASIISVGVAAPAQAATCYWYSGQFGTSSNCDNKDPDVLGPSCGSDARTIYTVRMVRSYDGAANGPYLDLRYSGNCRTVWARIRGAWGPDQDQFGCYVTVHRNSDGQEYFKGLPHGSVNATAWTNVVYDANVTSYARASCDTGPGYSYTGKTASW
jgi:Protein of unknown function (DUF2690)